MMLADTIETPLRRRSRISWSLRLDPFLHRDPSAGQHFVDRHPGDRLGQHRFRDGFDEGGGILDLEQKLRRIADHVLQDQATLRMLVSPVKSSMPGGISPSPDGKTNPDADFHDARRLDDVDAVDRPWQPVVHAGSDLICHSPEPAHYRTLIGPDDVEARGQVQREQDWKRDRKPEAAAALERAREMRRGLDLPLVAARRCDPGRRERHRSSSPDFFFRSRSASAAERAPPSCGAPTAPTGAGAPGAGSPAGGCASKRNARRTSASAGRNTVVLSSRILSYAWSVRRNW